MRSRLAAIATALALLGGSGGAIALAQMDSHPNNDGGAADHQYRPGKGCGDKNHQHGREDECKRHGGHGHGGGDD